MEKLCWNIDRIEPEQRRKSPRRFTDCRVPSARNVVWRMVFLQETRRERQPRHVAIIMDGNGRWARSRGLSRLAGHGRGVEALRRAVASAVELGIEYLTVFAFSSENWERPAAEVDGLMGLLRRYLRGEVAELHEAGVRLRFIGELTRLPDDINELIADAESLTAANHRLTLTVALNYGSRREFLLAVRRLAADAAAGRLDPKDIGERQVGAALFTADLPDPDLIIRTGGERRMSTADEQLPPVAGGLQRVRLSRQVLAGLRQGGPGGGDSRIPRPPAPLRHGEGGLAQLRLNLVVDGAGPGRRGDEAIR